MAQGFIFTQFVISLIGLTIQQVNGASWSYSGDHGPDHWANSYQKCGGSRQSPIDIKTDSVSYKDLGAITFTHYDVLSLQMKMKNNGHAAQVDILSGDAFISGGNLPGSQFKLAQFHFHWGNDSTKGSEHLFNGKAYPVEMHLVHYNTKYNSISAAISQTDGLAVLGVFITVGTTENANFQPIISKLKDVKFKDNTVDIGQIRLDSLLPAKKNEYYRYAGSLTTPECDESVTWTVFNAAVELSESQIAEFRELKVGVEGESSASVALVDNFRPPQSLNDRQVFSSSEALAGDATRISSTCVAVLIIALCVLLL